MPPTNYTLTYTNVSANSFVDHRVFNNLTIDNTWTCTKDGLVASQVANAAFLTASQFKLETLKTTGVTIPPANGWKIGRIWSNEYTIKGTMVTNGQSMTAQGPIEIMNKITTQGSVTVPAGTFNTFQVDETLKSNLTANLGLIDVPVNFDYTSTSWYAENVGLVKTVTTGTIASVTELTSFKR